MGVIMIRVSFLFILISMLTGSWAFTSTASFSETKQVYPGRLSTQLSEQDIARREQDKKSFPHFMSFVDSIEIKKGIRPVDLRNKHLVKASHVFTPTPPMWNGFFQAAAKDKMTVLRAFSTLARELKGHGVVMMGPGKIFEQAVKVNGVDLGLAMPAKNVGFAIWHPDPGHKDPEFQAHLKVFYTKSYIHRFPDHILEANLKIGYGQEDSYWYQGQEYTQVTIDVDIFNGENNGIGFRNVKGVGGQKRGLLGFLQKVFFFLPDAVDAMVIQEKTGVMTTYAFVNNEVANFESTQKYSISVGNKK